MKTRERRAFHFAIILAVVVWLGVLPAAAEEPAVKIGVVMPLTGDLTSFGVPLQQVAALAMSHVNEQGGILGGRLLELVFADDRTDPEVGVVEAQRLLAEEGVSGFVTVSSGVTLRVATEVSVPNRIVQVSIGSSPRISALEDDDYVFRIVASDSQQGHVLGTLAARLRYTSVAILYVDNEYGNDLARHFEQSFAGLGGRVVASVPFRPGRLSYRELLEPLAELDAEALVLIAYPESGVTIVQEALTHGYFRNFLFSDGLQSPSFVQEFGFALDGAWGTAPSSSQMPGAQEIKRLYEERYGKVGHVPLFAEMYDAVFLLALAIEKAGETSGPAIREAIRQLNAPWGEAVYPGEWAKAVALMREGKEIQYMGNPFPLGFDENGDIMLGMIEMWTVINGEIRTVATDFVVY